MALSIKDEETDALVRKLARIRNLSFTQAIRLAVANELKREAAAETARKADFLKTVAELQARIAARPDRMTAAEVDALMYDENGLPH